MKKNVQKLLALLTVPVILLGLTACGGDASGSNGGSNGGSNSGNSHAPAGKPGTVAQPMDLDAMFAAPANAVQDFHYWTAEEFPYESNPSRDDDPQVNYYMRNDAAIAEYVAMLQKNGFTLVNSYQLGDLFEWSLTSDRCSNASTIDTVFTDSKCHVNIWGGDSNRKFRVDVSPDLKVCDIGLRRDGSVADVRPQGASAGAGLVRLADGSYQTSDGRLTAPVGTAMVLRDGKTYNTTATFDQENGVESIMTGDYYRDQFIYLQNAEHSLMAGDIFREQDLAGESVFEELDNDSVTGRSFGNKPGVVLSHGDKALMPCFVQNNFDDVTMRVMYYDQGGDAVYYVYARFADNKEPKEVEALIAVNMAGTGAVKDATYVKTGSTVKLDYTHREFGAHYDVFKWEVVEGAGNVSLDYTGSICNVTAVAPGFAIVRVTYEYSIDEPDVLTGIMRPAGKAITQDYSFIIE